MRDRHPEPFDESAQQWEKVLRAGVEAQKIVPEAVAAGGTAAAIYAHHRMSLDVDHLVSNLRDRFEEVRETLERTPDWKTARVFAPKMILGSLGDVPIGFRQMIRSLPLDSTTTQTPSGPLVIPTLDEMVGMKAYLAYSRRAARDFLDFAALASCAGDVAALASLLRSDERYGELQSDSVGLEIAKALAAPEPFDLESVDLSDYKGVKPPWNKWSHVEGICRSFGERLAEALLHRGSP
jgi:hypothetical protein